MRLSALRGHRSIVSLILLLASAVLAGALFLPLSSSQSQTAATTTPSAAGSSPSNPLPTVQSVDPNLEANLGLFRRAPASVDALPARLSSDLPALLPGAGANPALARQALVTPDGTSVYLIPSAAGMCLVDSSKTESFCAPTDTVLSGGATAGIACSPYLPSSNTVEISGILPDSASDVSVLLSNGTSEPLAVQGNAYLQQFSRSGPLPTSLQWSSNGQTHSTGIPLPSDASTITCVTPAQVQALAQSGKIPSPLGHPPAGGGPVGTVERTSTP